MSSILSTMLPCCKLRSYECIILIVADFYSLDDIEDGSEVRRGKPAAHIIFGSSQIINSAGYAMMLCLEKVLSLDSKTCLHAYTGLHFQPKQLNPLTIISRRGKGYIHWSSP